MEVEKRKSPSISQSPKTLPKRPRRGVVEKPSLEESVTELCELILLGRRVVFLTGAGLSVASGIAPFRGRDDAVWEESVHEWGTREKFEEDSLAWYNEFWLKHFDERKSESFRPNSGHIAIAKICQAFPGVKVLTQNIDRLHRQGPGKVHDEQLIEIHGYAGAFKCYGEDCKFSKQEVLAMSLKDKIETLENGRATIRQVQDLPNCPGCQTVMVPNCLLFDEEYTDHESYQFDKARQWLKEAEVICFVGTSFAVRITQMAFCYAAENHAKVFNFNLDENVPKNQRKRVQVESIRGPCEDTLVMLLRKLSI